MALKGYQTTLSLSRLYEIKSLGGVSGGGSALNSSIWANDLVSIYGSNSATQPSSLSDMVLEESGTDVSGMLVLPGGASSIPRYIAITGAATEIVATGLEVENLAAIS